MAAPASCVPNFMVFDQPSQVYFPAVSNLRQGNQYDEILKNLDNVKLDSDDRESVRKIFSTLSHSTRDSNFHWQAIVLEHAGEDVYGNVDGVVECANWHNGDALIPKAWYEKPNTAEI